MGRNVEKLIEDVVSEVSDANYFDTGPEQELRDVARDVAASFRAEPQELRGHILAAVKNAAEAMIADGSVVIDVDEGDGLDPDSVRQNAARIAKESGIPIGKAMALVHKMGWAEYATDDDYLGDYDDEEMP